MPSSGDVDDLAGECLHLTLLGSPVHVLTCPGSPHRPAAPADSRYRTDGADTQTRSGHGPPQRGRYADGYPGEYPASHEGTQPHGDLCHLALVGVRPQPRHWQLHTWVTILT